MATPEEEEQVRRLLGAAARPTTPLPQDVARRLDDVLAGLTAQSADPSGPRAAEEPAPDEPAPDELAARRETRVPARTQPPSPGRGRRWPQVLVAAAAVGVLAVGGGVALRALTQTGSSSESSASAPAKAAPQDAAGSRASGPLAAPTRRPVNGAPTPRSVPARVAALHTATLRSDLLRLAANAGRGARAIPVAGSACRLPETGPGDALLAVRLDGRPATVLLTAPAAGTREAQVYACDDGATPVASTSVPAG